MVCCHSRRARRCSSPRSSDGHQKLHRIQFERPLRNAVHNFLTQLFSGQWWPSLRIGLFGQRCHVSKCVPQVRLPTLLLRRKTLPSEPENVLGPPVSPPRHVERGVGVGMRFGGPPPRWTCCLPTTLTTGLNGRSGNGLPTASSGRALSENETRATSEEEGTTSNPC